MVGHSTYERKMLKLQNNTLGKSTEQPTAAFQGSLYALAVLLFFCTLSASLFPIMGS